MKNIDEHQIQDYTASQGIYAFRNQANGKYYIGKGELSDAGWSLAKRLKSNLYNLRHGRHNSDHLQKAWDKYGEDQFEMLIIEEVPAGEDILAREQYWIDLLKSSEREFGYNMSPTAGTTAGFQWSEASKEKIRGEGHPFYGKQHSDESRKKMSETLKGLRAGESHPLFGKKHSDASRKKMSETKKGMFVGEKNPFYGKQHSEETKAKISQSRKGQTVGEQHPMYGKHHSDESKEKMRQAKLGREQPSEQIEKRIKSIRMIKRANQKYKGVWFEKSRNKYRAYVDREIGRLNIGAFSNEEEAAKHYDYYAIKVYGKGNCFLNFPDENYDKFQPSKVIEL